MSPTSWFSSMLNFAVLVEGESISSIARSVVVLQATDFDDAQRVAVRLGLAMEKTYVNGTGAEVRWRLIEVETVDELGPEIDHGREVYSERVAPAGKDYSFDSTFRPEESNPTQSGV